MNTLAIRVEGLGKKYRIGAAHQSSGTLRGVLQTCARQSLGRLVGSVRGKRNGSAPEEIWALRDVNFEVSAGEAVGVIGRNGAGKSTLLKILSRITEPTTGRIGINGRVGSLLEVGTGFHPELTGRENVYLNGAILGMHRVEIRRKFDEIVEFAEIEKFLETPVKHYSSGMYMRLAFAVAAHLEPDILFVDEVLAVGDLAFQKKCLSKVGDFARQGRTVMFVSHNLVAVQNLCEHVIWLDNGRVAQQGHADDVIAHYRQTNSANWAERVWECSDPMGLDHDEICLLRAEVHPTDGDLTQPITVRTPLSLHFEYHNNRARPDFCISFRLYNHEDTLVFESKAPRQPRAAGTFRETCFIPGDLLNIGRYRVLLRLGRSPQSYREYRLFAFDVDDTGDMQSGWFGIWRGSVRPRLEWTVTAFEPSEAAHRGVGKIQLAG
jgi:lipopolysaccharide transport system ATP-binding protein